MALRHCRGCTTAYAVGIPACPHCEATEFGEEAMPKITRHGGPSNAGAPAGSAPAAAPDHTAEEVPSSPGNSSSPSPKKPASSPKTSGDETPKRARTTANRSSQDRTGGSSARSTAGDRTAPRPGPADN